ERVLRDRFPRLVGHHRAQDRRDPGLGPAREALGLEVAPDDAVHLVRMDLRVAGRFALRVHDLDERTLVAHARAADRLDSDVGLKLVHRALQRLADVLGAAGDAAGSQADPELRRAAVARRPRLFLADLAFLVLLARQEVPDRAVHGAGREIAVDGVVELDDRGQRDVAQASGLVERV